MKSVYTGGLVLLMALAVYLKENVWTGDDRQRNDMDMPVCTEQKISDRKIVGGKRLEIPARLKSTPERLLFRVGYTLSFNRERNQPNWVAWQLTDSETEGHVSRLDEFLPDPDIPAPHRVTTADYRHSGYDRGHMAPAADMKWSGKAMKECFYMSNICPQQHELNGGPWAKLENACRRWARNEGAVYIVCGPVFGKGHIKCIGKNFRIPVPKGFFKVILSIRKGHEKAIGFYYRNRAGRQSMASAALTVDQVEQLTGIDFFPTLPDSLERRVEASARLQDWK